MKQKKELKILSPKLAIKREEAEQGKLALVEQLLRGPESKIRNKFSDENLDRQNEIIQLIGGSAINLPKLSDFIAKSKQQYVPTFPQEFYTEIDRLNGWVRPKETRHQKPPIVGRWTKELIYGRFPKEVLPVIEQLNPYMGFGARLDKHFQWLTPGARCKLESFISQAIEVMKISITWYEFKVNYCKKYNLPMQIDLFY
ncbi:P63C domain-containing protein [Sediminibacterium sp.]|uniref:P63C domain-containing protein n=1 Tax=Sediminibacterium sp. TaxID=1917865 RepID=UPI003F69EF20